MAERNEKFEAIWKSLPTPGLRPALTLIQCELVLSLALRKHRTIKLHAEVGSTGHDEGQDKLTSL